MKILNCTPHPINLVLEDGREVVFPPCGTVARCATSQEVVGTLEGAPVARTVFGAVTGLPAPAPGVTLLVSSLVAQAANRPDVVSPDTGATALREGGVVKAVRGFQVFG